MRIIILIVILLAAMYLFVFLGIRKKHRNKPSDVVAQYHETYIKKREGLQNRRDSISSRSKYNQTSDRGGPNPQNRVDYREK